MITLFPRSPSPDIWVAEHAAYLDSILKSTILAFASMVPGIAGQVSGVGAAVYDISHTFWIGGTLSLLSVIPVIGYVPGAAKIAWNLRKIDAELREIEEMLPSLCGSAPLMEKLQSTVGRYFKKIANAPGNLEIIIRLRKIMEFPPCDEPSRAAIRDAELGLNGV